MNPDLSETQFDPIMEYEQLSEKEKRKIEESAILSHEDVRLLINDYRTTNSEKSFRLLHEKNQGMIHLIAKQVQCTFPRVPIEEFIQQGNVLFLDVIRRFDTSRDTKFSTYAWKTIRPMLYRFAAGYMDHIHIPEHLRTGGTKGNPGEPVRHSYTSLSAKSWYKDEEIGMQFMDPNVMDGAMIAMARDKLRELIMDIATVYEKTMKLRRQDGAKTVRSQFKIMRLKYGFNRDMRRHTFQEIAPIVKTTKQGVDQKLKPFWKKLQAFGCPFSEKDFLRKLEHIDDLKDLLGIEETDLKKVLLFTE